jgi:iron complex outermembrane recepter protein
MKIHSVAAAVAVALGTTAAWSAEPAQNSNELDEVIVTAQFREQNLQDTAIAITAVSGDRLEDQGITNVEDLGLVIPNAQIRPQGSFSGPTPTVGMRGVSTTDYIYTSEPGVGIYVDEVYQGTLTGSAIDLLDLERVEVLRGPQGTLFGKNSLGGAIRLFSKQPKGDDTGHVELTYGTSNRLDLKGSYDFAITDNLFLRVSGVSKQIDGYQDVLDFTCQMKVNGTPALAGTFPTLVPSNRQLDGNCKIAERGGFDTDAGRVMLRWLAADNVSVDVWADYSRTHAEPQVDTKLTQHQPTNFFNNLYSNTVVFPAYGIRFTADDRFVTGNPFTTYANPIDPIGGKNFPPDTYTTAWDANGKLAWKFGDKMEFDFIVGYRTYESDWMGDGDQMPIDLNHTYELQSHDQVTLEARLQGTLFDDRLDWTAGLYRYDDNSHLGGYVTLPAFAAILPNFNENDSFTAASNSGFVHGIFKVTDALSVTGGIRYTDETKTYAFDHRPYLFVPGKLEYGSSHTDWKLGADYRFNPEVMVYVSAATGFRSDGAQPRPFTPGQQRIPVPAEELTSYEIGMKTDLFDRRVRVNVAAFVDDYDPRIFTSFGTQCAAANKLDPGEAYHGISAGNPCPAGTDLAGTTGIPWIVYDSAPGKDKGVELEVSANPVSSLQLNATLAWFDFKSGVDPTAPTGGPNFGYVNPDFKVQPEISGSLGAQYTFNFAGGSLTPRVDWFYQGSRSNGAQYLPQYDENQVGGYGLVNARINYATGDGKWNVALIADNLLDKFYWYALGPARDSVTGSFAVDNRTGSPARGREIALSLQRNFN